MTPPGRRNNRGGTGRGTSYHSSRASSGAVAGPVIERSGGIRLQKYLSDLGLGSRRQVESWIEEGRIRVDGRAAELGQKVSDRSRILLDGKPVSRRPPAARDIRVIAYNKPEGEICSRDDPAGRPTVFRNLPRLRKARWVAVGRLDINTRGLLLFTTDGDLANRLMHPDTGLEREYLCRVFGDVGDAAIDTLRRGVELDGERIGFHSIARQRGEGRNTWFRVVVTEGRYREVRRLWESVGCRVSRLVRVRYGPVRLPRGVPTGGWAELGAAEVGGIVRTAQSVPSSRGGPVDRAPARGYRGRKKPGA